MKNTARYAAMILLAMALMLVLPLSSCGSELDGTWRSRSDEDTRIKIAGENVRIIYDIDDEYNITFHLTDRNGYKYKIVAKLNSDSGHKTITLTNSKGESEIFEKR